MTNIHNFSGNKFAGLIFDGVGGDGISINPDFRSSMHDMPREIQFNLIKRSYALLAHAHPDLKSNNVVVMDVLGIEEPNFTIRQAF